jgi:hypothetical protein
VSSSRRPGKRPSGVKAVAKPATARRKTAKRPTQTRTVVKGGPAKRPAATKSKPVRAVKPPARQPSQPAPSTTPSAPAGRRAFRLAGSASSRLTIKPGTSPGPRPPLELSTKRRPSGPRRLSDVELDEDEVLVDAFDAMLEGVKVRITAVLERTCVYIDTGGDRRLARKIDLWVEADKLPIRRRGLG